MDFCFQSLLLRFGFHSHANKAHAIKADSRLAPQGGLLLSELALADRISYAPRWKVALRLPFSLRIRVSMS